ncbi:DNA mismatch repair protein Msh2 [Atheta coriaria]|uniref:DNA mismatch repair protein Msh2 n=1 Tax=Dalotia coriaria TaxID=877792 RepID=UPI0031F3C88A
MANVQPLKAMNLDPNQIQGFIRFYKNMSEKSASTVRIFHHAEFYSVHEDDATLAAEIVFKNNVTKYMGTEKLPYLCLSENNFENFIRELLLVRQYRVEVYEKVSPPRVNDWKVEYKASPGNLQQFESILFENNRDMVISTSVMGVHLRGHSIGLACVNTTECDITVTEFDDNEFFSELEAVVAYVNPKECVIPSGSSKELETLKEMLERNDVLVGTSKKEDYDESKLDQDLNRLLYFAENQTRNVHAFSERKLTQAMCSARAVINSLNLMSDTQNFNQYRLKSMNQKRLVRIDNAAIYALNLLAKPGTVNNQFDTVYGVLNNCSTPQGKRLLQMWIKQPIRDLNILNDRLEVVQALVQDADARSQLSKYRLKLPDLLMLAKRLATKKATLQDCFKVYQALDLIPALVETLQNINNAAVVALIVDPICERLEELQKYQRMIEETMELSSVDRDEYFVKPSYDPVLHDLFNRKQIIEDKMQSLLKRAANDLGYEAGKTIKLDCTNQHGYFFRVTLKEEQAMRKNKSYTIFDVVKGGVRFNNEKLASYNDDYKDIKKNYEEQQETVVDEIIQVASGYADVIKSMNQSIAIADVLVSFAVCAVNAPIPYVRPNLMPMGSGILRLKKARHPCLERQDDNCIPNDVDFMKDECTFKIITGPNMGGKSTYIRTVGVCTLLAHIGCFVPCEEADISIVDSIVTRVGAGDCESKGLSTFMMEMIDTSSIIRCATSNSLVIIDELGRGTSTYDGCGIAWAVAQHLSRETKAFTLFATHYHEITQLENDIPTVANYHVSMILTDNAITPLYSIKEGICDKSYGIQCAKVADFPENVIKWSTEYLKELECADGLKNIQNFEPRIRQKTIADGDDIAEAIRVRLEEKFKKESFSKDDLALELMKIKDELSTSGNLFIRGLLTN